MLDRGVGVDTKIVIPDGVLAAPDRALDLNNGHLQKRREIVVNGQTRQYEYIHQQQSGDCVLANFLNTWSFLNDGRLPMSVNEARLGAINLRVDDGINPASIRQIDSGLSHEDTVLLFAEIYGVQPDWEEDIVNVEGRVTEQTAQIKALDVLDYLASYPSGVCTTGLQEHSRTIVKLDGDQYALLNPTNPEGVEIMDTEKLMLTLAGLMKDRPPESNFFFFLRNK